MAKNYYQFYGDIAQVDKLELGVIPFEILREAKYTPLQEKCNTWFNSSHDPKDVAHFLLAKCL